MNKQREIKGYLVPAYLAETKRKTDAVAAICLHCGHTFEKFDAPWPMTKSIGLHERGLGHSKMLLLTFAPNNQ